MPTKLKAALVTTATVLAVIWIARQVPQVRPYIDRALGTPAAPAPASSS